MANFFDQFDAGPEPQSSISAGVRNVESSGRYSALGPVLKDGDRAYGAYQVLGKNIAPWSKEILGQEISVEQFISDPKIQDAIANGKMSQYEAKYGPGGAARAWFAGEGGMNDLGRKDQLGTSVADYERRVMTFAPQTQQQAPQPQSANFFDQFDGTQQRQPESFNNRFGNFQSPADGGNAMRAGLGDQAQKMMRGPAVSPGAQMLTEHTNVLDAARQGTTPGIDRYKGKLVSTDVFQNDSGEITYRDPQSGAIVPTDSKKHVALRDPVDGQIKIFSRGEDTNESGIVGASRVLSQGLAAGAPTARPGLAEPVAKSVVPRASEIASTAKPYYQAFRNEAGQITLSADDTASIATRLRGALDKVNLTEDMAGAPAKAALKMIEDGTVQTLDDLQKVKRVAGRGFGNSEKDARDAAAAISREVGRIISDVSKSAAQNLKTADDIFSTSRSVQELQRKAAVADLRTGRAGYGGNSVNNMRQVLSPIVEKAISGKVTGFQPAEIAAMKEIVEGTATTNALRTVGQLSPSKGILATAAAGSTGGVTGVVGALSNKAAAVLTGKQVERLNELVAKRSPKYAEAVTKAVDRYEQSQAAFVNNPSPNTFAGYLSASRALSAGFARDGISVTSADLLRSFQGPMKSAADNKQPESERVGNQ